MTKTNESTEVIIKPNVSLEEDNLKKKKKKSNFWIRQISSIVLIIIVLLFVIPAGLNPKFQSDIYNYCFLSVLGLLFLYAIFEITNFIFPYKEKKNLFLLHFIYISITFLILYFYIGIWFYQNFNFNFWDNSIDKTSIFITPNIAKDIFPFIWYLLFTTLILLLFTSFLEVKISDVLILLTVCILFFLFLLSTIVMLSMFNWVFYLMFVFIITFTDTFAYIGGKKYGKNKLVPNISPNKTKEGFLIGIVAGFLIGIVWYFALIFPTDFVAISQAQNNAFHFKDGLTVFYIILLIFFITLVGQCGDLFFSKIKRQFEKKDFSKLIPGHGGLFDRLDSHIFAIIISNLVLILIFI